MDRWQSCLLVQQKPPAAAPRLLPARLPLPCHWATQEGRAVAISWFLFTTHRWRAPAIDYHAFRVICKGKFPPPSFVLCFFLYMPSCCMPGSTFIVSFLHATELVHQSHTVSKYLAKNPKTSLFFKKPIHYLWSGTCPHPEPPGRKVKSILKTTPNPLLNCLVLNSFN